MINVFLSFIPDLTNCRKEQASGQLGEISINHVSQSHKLLKYWLFHASRLTKMLIHGRLAIWADTSPCHLFAADLRKTAKAQIHIFWRYQQFSLMQQPTTA